MPDPVVEEIQKKILRERNIITGATNMKKKTSNATVIQKCNTNIQEAQQNIDYLNERLNQLKFQGSVPGSSSSLAVEGGSVATALSGGNSNSNNSNSHSNQQTNKTPEVIYSKLDLMKYDCPSLGQRIQHMINQLDSKLKVEQKYSEANEKLSKIYQQDGDRRISSVAEDGRVQSNHKIQLLKKALKRYEAINVNFDHVPQNDESLDNVKFRRKLLAGTLTIDINSIRDVDHIASSMFSRKTESYITIRIDDEEKARTKTSKNDKWNESFNIAIERGNEVEITVFDKIGKTLVPVAIAWFLISDIAEEIRKKKVGQTGTGWVSASKVQNSDGSPIHNQNTIDNFTLNEKKEDDAESPNNVSKEPIKSSSWFILEPAGQILISLGFTKVSSPNKKALVGGLHRHGAIRKRDDEVFEQHGHQFIQKQFYSIMRCALCGDFLPYNGYQCQDCKFLCHKRCYEKVITKCISKSSTDIDPDELKINHRIPHRFEHVSNRGTNWCCHCGYILPWGRKNVLKCGECSTMCHTACSHLVPDFCGMSMETANQILKTIKETEVTRQKHVVKPQTASRSETIPSTAISSQPSRLIESARFTPTGPSSVPVDSRPGSSEPKAELPTQSFNQKQLPIHPTSSTSSVSSRQRRPPPLAASASSDYIEQPETASAKLSTPPAVPPSRNSPQSQLTQQDRIRIQHQESLHRKQLEDERRLFEQEQLLALQQQQFQQQQLEQKQSQIQVPVFEPQTEDLSFQIDNEEHAPQTNNNPFIQPTGEEQVLATTEPQSDAQKSDSTLRVSQQNSYATLSTRERRHRQKIGLDDFNFLKVLGRGNFGKVMLGRSNRSGQLCAVKILKKDMIVENGELASITAEKDVFLIANRENHPFLTNLFCCFQTANRIYFVMEFVSGGDLMWHVQQGNFSLRRAKFYACEVLLALQYLHQNGIIYRDLKLDNILLSPEGHIKLGDYGLCKPDMWFGNTTNTFCGTPEFMAPEILKEQSYSRAVDWWAYGVLLYQMLLGKSPFRGEDEDEIFNAIMTDEPLFPIQMASEAVGLLESLLDKDPVTRLGAGPKDALEVMAHPYFENVNFDDILKKKVPPPYVPKTENDEDVSYFEKDFTSEVPRLTPVNSVLDTAAQAQFRGFSYVNDYNAL
ncbi:hypothetical protein WICPIJ_005249 [Wickerhamomyces pijperi]|uniref:protein kinase C n=1 Tax=Wickerhamomyces pijperi TaxID=599730 RepID=A0A9P8Q6L7_WICPI|nr:hypothetical protein WICPIJ_005249 [Wickerhamomyces pijperi]